MIYTIGDEDKHWLRATLRQKCTFIDYPVGWEDLVLATHSKLYEIDPDYEVFRVSEKLGELSFSARPSLSKPTALWRSIFDDIVWAAQDKSRYIDKITGEIYFPRTLTDA